MKWAAWFVISMFVLSLESSALAQASETAGWSTTGLVLGIKAGAGIGAPFNELGPTFIGEVELGYALPLPEPIGRSLELFGAGAYLAPAQQGTASEPDARLPGDGTLSYSMTQQTVALTLGARYRVPLAGESIAPYLGAGARLYLMRTEVEGAIDGQAISGSEETSSALGFHGALGVDVRLGPGALLAEAQLGYAPVDNYVLRETNLGTLALLVGYRFMPMERARSEQAPVPEFVEPDAPLPAPEAAPEPAPQPAAAPIEQPAAAPVEPAPAAVEPAAPAEGEGTIQGNIRSFDGTPLQATVTVYPIKVKTSTNADGAFELNLKPGRYTVRLRAFGFSSQNRTIVVHENGVTVLNAELRKK